MEATTKILSEEETVYLYENKTVDLLIPNFFAVCRTVALWSMM